MNRTGGRRRADHSDSFEQDRWQSVNYKHTNWIRFQTSDPGAYLSGRCNPSKWITMGASACWNQRMSDLQQFEELDELDVMMGAAEQVSPTIEHCADSRDCIEALCRSIRPCVPSRTMSFSTRSASARSSPSCTLLGGTPPSPQCN